MRWNLLSVSRCKWQGAHQWTLWNITHIMYFLCTPPSSSGSLFSSPFSAKLVKSLHFFTYHSFFNPLYVDFSPTNSSKLTRPLCLPVGVSVLILFALSATLFHCFLALGFLFATPDCSSFPLCPWVLTPKDYIHRLHILWLTVRFGQ